MISKSVSMKKSGGGGAGALIDYITDDQENENRIGCILAHNCADLLQPRDVTQLMYRTQRAHGHFDRRSNLMYHMIVSFAPGEQPSAYVLQEAERRLCASIGFLEHQRLSVVHRDTSCVHIHVAINKVHPKTGRIHSPGWDRPKRTAECQAIERDFGLVSANHSKLRERNHDAALAMRTRAGTESLLTYAKRTSVAAMLAAQTWEQLHSIAHDNGLAIQKRGAGLIIKSLQADVAIKGSTASCDLSLHALEKKLGSYQSAAVRTTAPAQHYQKLPHSTDLQTGGSYVVYKAEQEADRRYRQSSLAIIKAEHDAELGRIQSASTTRRAAIVLLGGGRQDQQKLQRMEAANRASKIEALRDATKARRSALYRATATLTWADWLQRRAANGDDIALALLRVKSASSPPKTLTVKASSTGHRTSTPLPRPGTCPPPRSRGRLAAFSEIGAIRVDMSSVAMPPTNLKTRMTVTKCGTVIRHSGNGQISDDGQRLSVSHGADVATVIATLRLAQARYGNRLRITGSATFKMQAVQAAIAANLPLTFIDAAQDAQPPSTTQLQGAPHESAGTNFRSRVAAGRREHEQPVEREVCHARAARAALRGQPNADPIAHGAQAFLTDELRNLPQRFVAEHPNRSQMLLPSDVPGQLEQPASAAIDRLRRHVFEHRAELEGATIRPGLGIAERDVMPRKKLPVLTSSHTSDALHTEERSGAAIYRGAFVRDDGSCCARFEGKDGEYSLLALTMPEALAMQDIYADGMAVDTREILSVLRQGHTDEQDEQPLEESVSQGMSR